MTLYKVLGPNAEAIHGGGVQWFKPKGSRPGKWMPEIADVRCCQYGYHLVEIEFLASWLRKGCTIYTAEGRGASVTQQDKTAFAQARLIRRQYLSECDMRLFAADCAEHVLPIFLAKRPNDDRPAKTIEAARKLARGEIGLDESRRAAHAAYAAAAYAAYTAAAYAAYAAYTAATAAAAAHAAYTAAAYAAAAHAAYTAATAAAAHAAAAHAAYTAAAHAAYTAAAYAAAARSGERQWQGQRLLTYLKDSPNG